MNKVIAISGFPGSGKSALLLELSKRVEGACLDYDRYQQITDRPVNEISDWMRERADYDEFVIPALAGDLHKLKNGKSISEPDTGRIIEARNYIFFETPLGREHKQSGRYIDILVWLDLPLDVALVRNLKAFTEIFLVQRDDNVCRDNMVWLHAYLTNYLEHTRSMLLVQYNKIGQTADIVINAEQQTAVQAAILIDKLGIE